MGRLTNHRGAPVGKHERDALRYRSRRPYDADGTLHVGCGRQRTLHVETFLPLGKYNIARLKGGFQRLLADAQGNCMAISDGQQRHFDTRSGS